LPALLRLRRQQSPRRAPSAAQQPVAEPPVAARLGEAEPAHGQDRSRRRVGVELAGAAAGHLADQPVEHIGIGKLGGQGRPRNVARQCRQRAVAQGGGERLPRQIAIDHLAHLGVGCPHARQQPVSRADHLGEQIVLRLEVGIEGAAGQAGRQHDVVDVGAGVAPQAEQPGGMLEDLGPDAGGMAGAGRHDLSTIIPYV